MKKIATLALSAAMLLTLFAGCGSKETVPETTAAPETTVAPETTMAPETEGMEETEGTDMLEETEAVELNDMGKLIETIYANHKELDLPIMTTNLDVADTNALTYNTGLTSGDKIAEGAVSELMMGQPYSLVVLKVKNAADTAAVAQEMFDNIDQRKWVCVEADSKIGGYYDDVAFLFMVGSDFSEDVTVQSMMDAFKAAAGTDVTVIE